MYAQGQGTLKDDAEAVKWYRKAAQQGLLQAQHNLGLMYYRGKGVPQDYTEAAKWYHKAAEQGYAPAQGNLGAMYIKGQGVSRDYVQAYKWMNLSGLLSPPGQRRDDSALAIDQLSNAMTPAQIAEAEKLARKWWAKHTKKK